MVRAIIIGQHQALTHCLQHGFDRFCIRLNRKHRALGVASCLRHQGAALRRNCQRGVSIHYAAKVQRHDFPETVPGGHVYIEAKLR